MLELNLNSLLLLTKHFSKKLIDKDMSGKIINIGAIL